MSNSQDETKASGQTDNAKQEIFKGSSSSSSSSDNHHHNDESSTWAWVGRLISSPASYQRTMDEQRLERLRQCQDLARILQSCRQNQNHQRPQLEDLPIGIRSVRYFRWRKSPEQLETEGQTTSHANNANNKQNSNHNHNTDHSCIREEHALWACRGVALKCGQELVQLRDCFRQHTAPELLQATQTAYENGAKRTVTTTASTTTATTTSSSSSASSPSGVTHPDTSPPIPCASLQQTLGACVAKNATALAERQRQWKE